MTIDGSPLVAVVALIMGISYLCASYVTLRQRRRGASFTLISIGLLLLLIAILSHRGITFGPPD
jgi:hypothetical protein